MAPAWYQKKPISIQATQWTGGPQAADPIINWILTNAGTATWTEQHDADPNGEYPAEPECIRIRTLEGTMRALPGDWIIRGVNGEFYPCKPDIFTKTYTPDQYQESAGGTE